ncbi:platelet endothelial cell adhesion molecule isoform X4 [Scomber scombrus]|uniref:platelet endothelial cell adhesion molecule isoform X4 n=1 Tax=Scomber scombrus TaxID=13677 RepID=UPI002DD870B1|nr:platelet endothelial cell adhesion molecule isoform X4 [Scomber scombrus]
MGRLTLILLTSTLLSSYFHPGRVVDAQSIFTIREVSLSMEPSNDVPRDTNVTVRCRAVVSSLGQEVLNRQYTILKDRVQVYTKTTTSSEDLLYPLPMARAFNSGKYTCQIAIEDKREVSKYQKLTVTGLSKPELHLNKAVVNEGEEVTVRCTAPGETGSIIFYFYEDSKEIKEEQVSSNYAETKIRFTSTGIHKCHCAYTVVVVPDAFRSEQSNIVTVSVKEIPYTPVLEILPIYKIYEGDTLDISCSLRRPQYSSQSTQLILSQGTQLLSSGTKDKLNHSLVALAKHSGEFECRLEIGNVVKVAKKNVSVTELFSLPTLTMSPVEVFPREPLTLICKSESLASERLHKEELTYTLEPSDAYLIPRGAGVFQGKALNADFNYTCTATAKGIMKQSKILTVRPKLPVSAPKITVLSKVILGRPFEILCNSSTGTLPINYTLLHDYMPMDMITVKQPYEEARFTVTITRTDDISKYICQANNGRKELSRRLDATVIVPLSHPTLTVVPTLGEIYEGDHLYLICGVQGTPPVTFKWYRVGNENPLYSTTSNSNNTDYQVKDLAKHHSGMYFCEAINPANTAVGSNPVTIEVRMALWKKALIGGICLLVLAVLALLFVLYYRSKRGRREAAAELSVKPSSPKSDDSLRLNLTHDTEVYNAATVRVDRAVTSVWSERPPEAANDEETSMMSNEPDVEYTEVVHTRAVDSAQGATDPHDYGSVEYAELNGEKPEINHSYTEVNNYQDLPVPVD